MIVVVRDPETERETAFYGVNDFGVHRNDNGEMTTELWLHRTVEIEDDTKRMFNLDGYVAFATQEAHKISVDVSEMLADHIYYDDTDVVVGLTDTYHSTIKSVQACVEEEDVDTDSVEFVGDMSVIE